MAFDETNTRLRWAQTFLLVENSLAYMTDVTAFHDAYYSNMLGLAQVQRRYVLRLLPFHHDDDLDWLFLNIIEGIDAIQRRALETIKEIVSTQGDFLCDLLNSPDFTSEETKTLRLVRDAHTMLTQYLTFFTA